MKKAGRPKKTTKIIDSKQVLIDATVALVQTEGADHLTVRKVCEKAKLSVGTFYHYFENKDDLLMYFVREEAFGDCVLHTDIQDLPGRICELYMILVKKYQSLGIGFMNKFYTTGNKALSAYMGYGDGHFPEGTVMARSEEELKRAADAGVLRSDADIHQIAADICTLVKGSVFEWCLCEGTVDIQQLLDRLLRHYLDLYLVNTEHQ